MKGEENREKIDLAVYRTAMAQFGPSVSVGDLWISLKNVCFIQQHIDCDDRTYLMIYFDDGNSRTLTPEGTLEFHRQMVAGAESIKAQIEAQQRQGAQQIAKQLGILT